MEKMTVNELRKAFLDFFESKDHYIFPSASLIPEDDPSILLIPAGMAPLKKYFTGVSKPVKNRYASSQKCIRINDLENVGRTARHLTFFEMLGNFSFGDYFKRESLNWGLEFLLDVLKLPKDRLWPSVYEEDEESFQIWRDELGFPEERIVRLGKDDNFWEIGLGPCGPCSEIYIDRGPEHGCGCETCKPGCDCDRFIEFWNHVFTQFDRKEDGTYAPLKHKNIDTGMGLERIAMIVQGVDNVFEIDTMARIIETIENITGSKYKVDEKTNRRIRIITDHIRSITFLLSDGVIPSNEGRGYVLRKLLRRASLQMKRLGCDEPRLKDVALTVLDLYSEAYPLLVERKETILNMIVLEEEKFQQTLKKGLTYLEGIIETIPEGGELAPGEAFKLYDTYGFPFELTEDIVTEAKRTVDSEGFEKEMEKQRELARSAVDHSGESWQNEAEKELAKLPKTVFLGYEKFTTEATVLAIVKDHEIVQELNQGTAEIVLDQTVFYATSGGQVGDLGTISTDDFVFEVKETVKHHDLYIHRGKVVKGKLSTKDSVKASFERDNRKLTARNHSATHLLHKALNMVLGDGASQAGSYVDSSRLRFDFSYFKQLTEEELKQIEFLVNEAIAKSYDVKTDLLDIEAAKASGAKALFSEKYGDTVRVVSMGDYSKELCGGTHVKNTGEIGSFTILSERGIASGVRRIEALTSMEAMKHLLGLKEELFSASKELKTEPKEITKKIQTLLEEEGELKKENRTLRDKLAENSTKELLNECEDLDGIHLYALHFSDKSMDDLKTLADQIASKDDSSFIILATTQGGKVGLVSSASEKAVEAGYKAGSIIRTVANRLGGGGGGKDRFASAGAKDVQAVEQVFQNMKDLIRSNQ
ncbi:alanine--tRNA ligase [Guggenheimella bovis]